MSTVTPIAPDGSGLPSGVTYDASLGLITYRGRQVPAQTYEGAQAVVRAIDTRQPVAYQDYARDRGAVTRSFDPVNNARGVGPANSTTVVAQPRPGNPAQGLVDNPVNQAPPPPPAQAQPPVTQPAPAIPPGTRFDNDGNPIAEVTPVVPPTPLPPAQDIDIILQRERAAEARALQNTSPAPVIPPGTRFDDFGNPIAEVTPVVPLAQRAATPLPPNNPGQPVATPPAPTRPTNTPAGAIVNPDDPVTGFVFDPATGEQISADSAQARDIVAQQRRAQNLAATTPGENLSAAYDPETGTFGVWDNTRGRFVESGLTQQQAILAAQEGEFRDLVPDPPPRQFAPRPVPETFSAQPDENGTWGVWADQRGAFVEQGLTQQEAILRAQEYDLGDRVVQDEIFGFPAGTTEADRRQSEFAQAQAEAAANEAATRERARVQATLSNQLRQADSGDWRFKIRLAPGANYLYRGNDGQGVQSGILAPLAVTDGVIFPYTPNITTAYMAKYAEQDLPHSNYRGYFYSGSYPEGITVQSKFTAQDTTEANYLLAVIHFFRSVTKMFYGQNDAFRGAPPPLVFLQGFGAYQYSRHPCVVTRFNLNLPADVDYIRADVQPITGLNIQQGRRPGGVPPQSLPTNVFTGALARLQNAGATKGAIFRPAAAQTLGTIVPTYVPTMMDMTIELLPMQTRQQVSQGFSLRDYATGNLLRKGFW